MFSRVTVPLHIPTANVWQLCFLHNFANICYCLFFFLRCIYLFWETERMRREGAKREGERESQVVSLLSALSLTRGLNPWTARPWPEPKPQVGHLNWMSHWGAPVVFCFCFNSYSDGYEVVWHFAFDLICLITQQLYM